MRKDNQQTKVLQFPDRRETNPVIVPEGSELDLCTVTVAGDVLADHQLADGDLLFINRSFNTEEIGPGDICIIRKRGENFVRRVWIGKDGTVTLFDANGPKEEFGSLEDVDLLGVAIGFQRMFRGREW